MKSNMSDLWPSARDNSANHGEARNMRGGPQGAADVRVTPTSATDAFSTLVTDAQQKGNSSLNSGAAASPTASPWSPSASRLPYLAEYSPHQPQPTEDRVSSSLAGPSRPPHLPQSAPPPSLNPTSPGSGLGEPPLTSRAWEQIADGPGAGEGSSSVLRWPKKQTSVQRSSGSERSKRKPEPLALMAQEVGQDEERSAQIQADQSNAEMTPVTAQESTISEEMQALSILRDTLHSNLQARPVDSPLHATFDTDSEHHSIGHAPPQRPAMDHAQSFMHSSTISTSTVLHLLEQHGQLLILDLRSIGDFLRSHFPRSAHLSIPTLMMRRFRKSEARMATSWESLGGFVSTPAGKLAWDAVDHKRETDVVLVGMDEDDEAIHTMKPIVEALTGRWEVKILRGGWNAVREHEGAQAVLVSGELSSKTSGVSMEAPVASLPRPKDTPLGSTAPPPPAVPDITSGSRLIQHHPSMPSLRDKAAKRGLPALTLQVGNGLATALPSQVGKGAPPPPNVNPPRFASLDSFGSSSRSMTGRHPALTIDVGVSRARQTDVGGNGGAIKSPFMGSSIQTLCHAQSKLPPSPNTFSNIQPISSASDRIPLVADGRLEGTAQPDDPSNTETNLSTAGAHKVARNGFGPFIVSTILPKFLYLGPEITSQEEVDELKKLGVQRILNVAIECLDDEGLKLSEQFERYLRIPMRDIVEETNIGAGIRESCQFLDDARLHSQPTYVHCKAGKSRSVTVVLAYLIHANAWTLKTSYAYVAERRKGISPNIGFVAELMQFEESELGVRQSGGINGSPSQRQDGQAGGGSKGGRPIPRHMRDSLPPAWSGASLDRGMQRQPKNLLGQDDERKGSEDQERGEDRRQTEEEREVRKNGQWVHSRRAPVDRETLQPVRRASKAGLESLRTLAITSDAEATERPSPRASPGLGGKGEAHTPGTDTRVGWI